MGREFLFALLCLSTSSIAATHVNNLQITQSPTNIRFAFNVTGPVYFHHFQLKHPDRLVIDIPNAQRSHPFIIPLTNNNPVKKIRSAKRTNGDLRLVFDLKQPATFKIKLLPKRHRLVVDFPIISKTTHFTTVKKPLRDVIIVIDPGHGGKDPGATGRHGTHEKSIVLAISKKLQKIINKQPGFRAMLTRSRDRYLPLRRRLSLARRDKADMFVAIHADAYHDRAAHGASVYALSSRGATSEAARWLAKRENKSELMGGVNLSDKGHLLKSVLLDLSQTATIRASLMIGGEMIHFLDHIAALHHDQVEQAAFVVLKSPDIPSLLVETGFLSNTFEERRLRNSDYQQRVALAIAKGIRRYFTQRTPRDTWLSYWRDHPKQHKQPRGYY